MNVRYVLKWLRYQYFWRFVYRHCTTFPIVGGGVSTARVRAVLVADPAPTKALSRRPWNKSSAHTGFMPRKLLYRTFSV